MSLRSDRCLGADLRQLFQRNQMPAEHVGSFPTSLGESLLVRNQGISKRTMDRVAVADALPILRKLKSYERAWDRNGSPLQPSKISKQVHCEARNRK